MTLHVYDFDGVLFDTARECLAVSFATVKQLPAFAEWSMFSVPPDDVAEVFLANRHWVGPPWQYAVLLECIRTGSLPSRTDDFLAVARAQEAALVDFTNQYFATRRELSRDVARWCSVILPYEPALAGLQRSISFGRAAILSTRDDESIRKILGHFLGDSEAAVEQLPRAGTQDKATILRGAAATRGLRADAVFFVDDYTNHVIPARRVGISAQLALWGYSSADDVLDARAVGVPCLDLDQLDRAITAHDKEFLQ